jgi:hypothetical protein
MIHPLWVFIQEPQTIKKKAQRLNPSSQQNQGQEPHPLPQWGLNPPISAKRGDMNTFFTPC